MISKHFDISSIFRISLNSYAYGKRIQFRIDKTISMEYEESGNKRISFTINDPIVEKLLGQVKNGNKSTFCKLVVRQALAGIGMEALFRNSIDLGSTTLLLQQAEVVNLEPMIVKQDKLKAHKEGEDTVVSDVFISAFSSIKKQANGGL